MTLALAAIGAPPATAQQGRFDLLGPKIDVHVTRGDSSLPIASVPNLQPGDKLQVHADLPPSQSVHLLLVVAFLRGTTNPPPDKWFTRIETWSKKTRAEGVTVTVPDEAEQALMFIAPETGGDFSTLRNAVQGRPGTFVRASQDLNEASFEQSRIERYVQALQRVQPNSPADLLDHSRKLATTLNLKPNDECFKRPADEQLSCLRQSGTSLLLDDGHGQSLAQMITNGDTSNLIGAMQGTPVVANTGAAAYSAYVGTVLDLVRLLTGLHTAHFQYIPAVAFPSEDALNLRLNAAPSFHNPKSVIVIALPAIHKAVAPPLKLQDPGHVSCLLQPRMVLPLTGAPLVFATGFAHDLVLHLDRPAADGRTDLPLIPDAFEGGLVVAGPDERRPLSTSAPPARDESSTAKAAKTAAASPAQSTTAKPPVVAAAPTHDAAAAAAAGTEDSGTIHGTIRGYWGFDPFVGLTVPLQKRIGTDWTAAPRTELFAGRTNTLVLRSSGTACTEQILLQTDGGTQQLDWHNEEGAPNTLDVVLPLEKAAPGGITLQIRQFGTAAVQRVQVTAYSDVTRLREVRLHAGDAFATVTGTGLQEIQGGTLEGNDLQPADPNSDGTSVRLNLVPSPQDAKTKVKRNFKSGDHGAVNLTLRDGRVLSTSYVVDAARPSVTVLNRTATSLPGDTGLPLSLNDSDAVPLHSKVTLAMRATAPAKFSRSEKVEVGTTDGTLHTELDTGDGSLVLQDSHTALAFLNPEKAFGASAFGPLRFRVVTTETASDWQPLGLLVRTPNVQQVTCPARSASHTAVVPPAPVSGTESQETGAAVPDLPCVLTGTNLFLIESTSPDASFTKVAEVPEGYAADTLRVPRPADGHTLYLKLRDDPDHSASITLEPPAPTHPVKASVK